MSDVPSNAPHVGRKPARHFIEANEIANVACDGTSQDEEKVFEIPARLFEQLPFAVYVCDQHGLVRRYNRRAAELWAARP